MNTLCCMELLVKQGELDLVQFTYHHHHHRFDQSLFTEDRK